MAVELFWRCNCLKKGGNRGQKKGFPTAEAALHAFTCVFDSAYRDDSLSAVSDQPFFQPVR